MGFFDSVGNIIGSLLGQEDPDDRRDHENYWAEKNIGLQKEFAQQGVQWRVADAKKAGIHPLAALGASLVNYQPQQVGYSGGSKTRNKIAAIARTMGVGIQSAVNKVADKKMRQLQLEKEQAEIDLIKAQTGRINEPQTGGIPDPDRMNSEQIPGTEDVPVQVLKQKDGFQEGVHGSSRIFEQDGWAKEKPAEELVDLVSEDPVEAASWYGHLIKSKWSDWQNARAARRGSEKALMELRKRQQLLSRRLPQGEQYRYVPRRGWKRVKIGDEGSQIFYKYKFRVKTRKKWRRTNQPSFSRSAPTGGGSW